MTKSSVKFIVLAFLIWRFGLFVILYFAQRFLSLQLNFLGGGAVNYLTNPFFWAWDNFDGQHYVNIAQNGYGFGEYTFFPFYSILIKFFGNLLGGGLFSLNLAGQLISNSAFLISLFGFYKLARLDFSERISKISVIILLLFPTSFYFAAVYTESIFFAILMWSFYFARKKNYLPASILGLFATATRPIGIFIFPAFIIEWYLHRKKTENIIKVFPWSLTVIPVGLLSYMYYLKIHIGNALAFFSEQVYVGEHRSSHLILLPQVIYRYVFKIFPSLNPLYFPGVFFTVLEFAVGIVYFVVSLVLFFTTRFSYALFAFLAYLTPTFLGSFSSQPRYVLILFPVYFILAKYLARSKIYLFAFCLISFILLVISFSLFARGYWIS